jgi:hypothetical protein
LHGNGEKDRQVHADVLTRLIAQRFSWVEDRRSTRLMWHDCIGNGETGMAKRNGVDRLFVM